jgi:hypothetical protein
MNFPQRLGHIGEEHDPYAARDDIKALGGEREGFGVGLLAALPEASDSCRMTMPYWLIRPWVVYGIWRECFGLNFSPI